MTPTTVTAACRCPLCHDLLGRAVQRRLVRCKTCRTPYHRHCWKELGGCSTLGCSNRRRRREPAETDPTEIDPTETEARAPRPLPTFNLDDLEIATPCSADWDAMEGDDYVRHCATCDKQVFDISALPRTKAIALLTDEGVPPCTRLYRRADGRVITSDCVAGRLLAWRRRLKERRGLLAALASAALAVPLIVLALVDRGNLIHHTTMGAPRWEKTEAPIQLKVNQVKLFEEPWAQDDPPQTTARTRRNGVPQSEDYLTKDPYAEVEWLVPHVTRRSILLIRAVEEGETTFEMAFPESNRIKIWRVMVEGADPHDTARDERKAALRKKPERELRRQVNQLLGRGKTLSRERDSPGKESFYRRAYLELAHATDAATAWSEQLARQGRASKDVHRLLRRCEDAESKSRDEWERFVEQQIAIYEAMVGRSEAPEECVRQLKRVLRGVAHNCDVRYKRLSTLLVEGWRTPLNEDFKCEHDVE